MSLKRNKYFYPFINFINIFNIIFHIRVISIPELIQIYLTKIQIKREKIKLIIIPSNMYKLYILFLL